MSKSLILCSVALIFVLSACGARPTSVPAATTPAEPPFFTLTPAPVDVPAGPTAEPVSPTPTEPAPTPTPAGPCTDLASFVADVTIPDYAHFDQREAFTKTWRVKNVGTCTWSADYKAVYSNGDALGAPASIALSETAPNATLDISANMAAPARDGKFEIFYELQNAGGDVIPIDAGNTVWALITVGKYIAYAPPTATPGASGGAGLASPSCVVQTNAAFMSQMLTLINAQRAANSKPALTLSAELTTAAQSHSADMACNNFLSHTGWNGSTPDSRIAAAGFTASITRENIYAQPPQYGGDPQAAMDYWMSDQIHKDALLNDQVTQVGIGYAAYSRSALVGYFTVDFAAP